MRGSFCRHKFCTSKKVYRLGFCRNHYLLHIKLGAICAHPGPKNLTPNRYEEKDGVLYMTIYNAWGGGKKQVIADAKYSEVFRHFNWYISGGYAVFGEGKDKISMHRLVVADKLKPRLVVDHINRNRLDNREENLRVCTVRQNNANKPSKGGTSKFKGVTKNANGTFSSSITDKKKRSNLGVFESESCAAHHYNERAKKVFGEYAYLNEFKCSRKEPRCKFGHTEEGEESKD